MTRPTLLVSRRRRSHHAPHSSRSTDVRQASSTRHDRPQRRERGGPPGLPEVRGPGGPRHGGRRQRHRPAGRAGRRRHPQRRSGGSERRGGAELRPQPRVPGGGVLPLRRLRHRHRRVAADRQGHAGRGQGRQEGAVHLEADPADGDRDRPGRAWRT
nr:hypothetical protein [Angustibacter aerolatus]